MLGRLKYGYVCNSTVYNRKISVSHLYILIGSLVKEGIIMNEKLQMSLKIPSIENG